MFGESVEKCIRKAAKLIIKSLLGFGGRYRVATIVGIGPES